MCRLAFLNIGSSDYKNIELYIYIHIYIYIYFGGKDFRPQKTPWPFGEKSSCFSDPVNDLLVWGRTNQGCLQVIRGAWYAFNDPGDLRKNLP